MNSLVSYHEWALVFLSFALGIIFIRHGYPKLFEPKPGFKILGALEILASLAVILGYYMQVGALFMMLVMLGAMYFKIFQWKTGFMSRQGTGWEFDFLIFFAAFVVATS